MIQKNKANKHSLGHTCSMVALTNSLGISALKDYVKVPSIVWHSSPMHVMMSDGEAATRKAYELIHTLAIART